MVFGYKSTVPTDKRKKENKNKSMSTRQKREGDGEAVTNRNILSFLVGPVGQRLWLTRYTFCNST